VPGPRFPRVRDAIRRNPTRHNAPSREFGVSVSAGYRVAADYDLADAWEDRHDQTEAATAARAADLAKRRTELQAGLLDDIAELRDRLFGDVIHLHVVKSDQFSETVLPAGPAEWHATMGAINAAARQTANLARLDAETAGAGQASGLLEQSIAATAKPPRPPTRTAPGDRRFSKRGSEVSTLLEELGLDRSRCRLRTPRILSHTSPASPEKRSGWAPGHPGAWWQIPLRCWP
jgi:hypothetical protein